jgi:hypothetical protein
MPYRSEKHIADDDGKAETDARTGNLPGCVDFLRDLRAE